MSARPTQFRQSASTFRAGQATGEESNLTAVAPGLFVKERRRHRYPELPPHKTADELTTKLKHAVAEARYFGLDRITFQGEDPVQQGGDRQRAG